MQNLRIDDFNCDECGLVSMPGTCELCRNRVKQSATKYDSVLAEGMVILITFAVVAMLVFAIAVLTES